MTTLAIGDQAPLFTLSADDGTDISLAQYRGQVVVMFFYPKDDTPGCTKQACGFRDHHAQIVAQGAVVLGISPDSVASHQAFKAKYTLPFPLLADTDHAVCEAYGVWGEKSMYGRKYMGVTRSHVVIAADGTIRDIRYKVSPEDSIKLALKAVSAPTE